MRAYFGKGQVRRARRLATGLVARKTLNKSQHRADGEGLVFADDLTVVTRSETSQGFELNGLGDESH